MTHVLDGLGVPRKMGLKLVREPDPRDLVLAGGGGLSFPETFSEHDGALRPVYDQGDAGSCASNATALAFAFEADRQANRSVNFDPARLFLYDMARLEDGTTLTDDGGSTIRAVFAAASKKGICREDLWPYITSKLSLMPSEAAFADAQKNRVQQWARAAGVNAIKAALSRGHLLVFGMDLPDHFMSREVAQSGVVDWRAGQKFNIGGHAMVVYGWDKNRWKVRNSWGQGWGVEGNCLIDMRFTQEDVASDYIFGKLVETEADAITFDGEDTQP